MLTLGSSVVTLRGVPGRQTAARVPETENHLLMIETSRYLTNQAMLGELGPNYPNADVIREQQEEVKNWLLARLQSIAKNDFQEYNSRAYQRYSINAIATSTLPRWQFDVQLGAGWRIGRRAEVNASYKLPLRQQTGALFTDRLASPQSGLYDPALGSNGSSASGTTTHRGLYTLSGVLFF